MADGWEITARVANGGKADTQDVVQVYAQNQGSASAPVNPRLCAFARVELKAGESREVVLKVDAGSLLVVNEAGERVSEGAPVLYVGMGQPDALTEKLTGHKAVKLENL